MSDRAYCDGRRRRPLVTFVVFAFNQQDCIREAIHAAFSQTYEPLEIILSDDCSVDRTFEIMQEMASNYHGPHRVRIFKQSQNLGLAHHINAVSKQISGDLVVVAAGDDISEANRTETLADIFFAYPKTTAIFSNYSTIPEGGDGSAYGIKNEIVSLTEVIIAGGGVQIGATYAYKRQCFDWPNPLPGWVQSEDRVLPLRAALLGEVRYSERKLVRYRTSLNPDGTASTKGRVHGYNNALHFRLLHEHVSAAKIAKNISPFVAFASHQIINLLETVVSLRQGNRLCSLVSKLFFTPLRLIRKAAVAVNSIKY